MNTGSLWGDEYSIPLLPCFHPDSIKVFMYVCVCMPVFTLCFAKDTLDHSLGCFISLVDEVQFHMF